MLDRFLDKKRNLYALAIVAIVFESLSSTVLKLGGQYPFLSAGYLFFFCLAVGIMALYAVPLGGWGGLCCWRCCH